MSGIEDYAQYLLEEARSSVAALHQFRILYEPHREEFHFFFEGEEDSLFYMPEARRRIGLRQVHIYDCGGKKNVIEARDTIKSECYQLEKCLFFVDRDYDSLLGCQVDLDEHTYITDYYSIESDLTNQNSTRVLLSDVIRVSQADPEFARIESDISNSMLEFYKEVLPLSAWILAAKQSGCGPNLRNTDGLKKVVSLAGLKPVLTKAGFIEFKKKVVVNGKTPAIASIVGWARSLDIRSAKTWVRGKYDIWFYQVAILAALERTNVTRRAAGGRAVRVPGAVREGRFFEALGGRVPVPASLQAFYASKLH